MQRALDFDKTLALSVPLPFLLNVPTFGLLVAAVAIWAGPQAFASRWSTVTMAITHLWTLGILGSAMLGALMQILAVACNVPVSRSRVIARAVHAFLVVGSLSLAAGFLWWWPQAWLLAQLTLALAFILFLLSVGHALWRHRKQVYKGAREILVPVRASLIALALTVVLGLGMSIALAAGKTSPGWVNTHVLWGLLGWSGLLLMAMSFQLVPIFQVTEIYPAFMTRWFPLLVPMLLIGWTALSLDSSLSAALATIVEAALAAAYGAWACTTIYLLLRRKRPRPESTTLFWFTSMTCLLACVPAWLLSALGTSGRASFVLGVLIIVGSLGSVVNGMLYKIVPFLLWKHAQDAIVIPDENPVQVRLYLKLLPKMATYIPEKAAITQWILHCLVIVLWTLAAAGHGLAAWLAGPALLASMAALAWNLGMAIVKYRGALQALDDLSRQLATAGKQTDARTVMRAAHASPEHRES